METVPLDIHRFKSKKKKKKKKKKKERKKKKGATSLITLCNALRVEWNDIPVHVMQRYVNYMWRGILEVITKMEVIY